jgi:sugar O-acyltransferase (sialic acid O-acetyltransferase NeuD family)
MKIGIIGAGGLTTEIMTWILQEGHEIAYLYDSTTEEQRHVVRRGKVYEIQNTFMEEYEHVIGVGYPETKQKIIGTIDKEIKWCWPIRHKSCAIGEDVLIGMGSMICPLVTITSESKILKLATINTNVTIGHNCEIGEMFHASAGAVISGNVTIGDRVFLGANACIKEKINICSDVLIGAGATVIEDIKEPGMYAGNPAREIS